MELGRILRMADGPDKTAALAAWVQSLFGPGEVPVLVGGAAVEIYTRGASTTGDLDLVGAVTSVAASALANAGFVRSGRHWVHEEGQVYLEFPSTTLLEGEQATRVRRGGVPIVIISGEDLLAERLAAWQGWRSAIDGVNAFLLFRALRSRLDRRRAQERAARRGASAAWRRLVRLARGATGRRPTRSELMAWAMRIPE